MSSHAFRNHRHHYDIQQPLNLKLHHDKSGDIVPGTLTIPTHVITVPKSGRGHAGHVHTRFHSKHRGSHVHSLHYHLEKIEGKNPNSEEERIRSSSGIPKSQLSTAEKGLRLHNVVHTSIPSPEGKNGGFSGKMYKQDNESDDSIGEEDEKEDVRNTLTVMDGTAYEGHESEVMTPKEGIGRRVGRWAEVN